MQGWEYMLRTSVMGIAMLIASVTAAFSSDNPIVSFFVGRAYIATDSQKRFMPAIIGMRLKPGGFVKTDPGSIIEIAFQKRSFTIRERSLIAVADLVRQPSAPDPSLGIIKKVFTNTTTINSITRVIAVRADDTATGDEVTWYTDDASLARAERKKIYESMQRAFSQNKLQETIDINGTHGGTMGAYRDRAAFLAAIAHMRLGSYQQACAEFERLAERSTQSDIAESARFYAGVSREGLSDRGRSIDHLSGYLARSPRGEHADAALFLRGTHYASAKDAARARADFQKLVDSFPSSPYADDTRKMLHALER